MKQEEQKEEKQSLPEDYKRQLNEFGIFGYTPQEMVKLLDIEEISPEQVEFYKTIQDPKTEEYEAYHYGIRQIEEMGGLAYPLETILIALRIQDNEKFREDFANPESHVYQCYQRGKVENQYIIDREIKRLAQAGNPEAILLHNTRISEKLRLQHEENPQYDLDID